MFVWHRCEQNRSLRQLKRQEVVGSIDEEAFFVYSFLARSIVKKSLKTRSSGASPEKILNVFPNTFSVFSVSSIPHLIVFQMFLN